MGYLDFRLRFNNTRLDFRIVSLDVRIQCLDLRITLIIKFRLNVWVIGLDI